ncbi:MAG UNVERIFIED_CONTAM: WecB/TagA/CpsF family glycosyltransferase [Microcystis novacekii LVE1205-3]
MVKCSQAPGWVMKIGLEWLYRLFQEPGRLWQRYLINNPSFLLLLPYNSCETREK